jgi:hypothetical protein|nr:MAG TPA: hypothetical protein [Bacteriophage sp.]
MKNKRKDWIKADLHGLDVHCKNKILYGSLDTFLKKCLKIKGLSFHSIKYDHIYPDSIKVKKAGYRFEIHLPYNLNGKLLDSFVLARMGKRVKFELDNYNGRDPASGYIINTSDQACISKLVLNYFIITKLYGLLKENKVNEAFDFFMDVFDECYYGSQFGLMGL